MLNFHARPRQTGLWARFLNVWASAFLLICGLLFIISAPGLSASTTQGEARNFTQVVLQLLGAGILFNGVRHAWQMNRRRQIAEQCAGQAPVRRAGTKALLIRVEVPAERIPNEVVGRIEFVPAARRIRTRRGRKTSKVIVTRFS
jgi:hypothetical protein